MPSIPSNIDLCSLSQLQDVLSDSGINNQDQYQRLITAASQFLLNLMNRPIWASDVTEFRDGSGSDFILPYQYPINSVALVQAVSRAVGSPTFGAATFASVQPNIIPASPDGIQSGYIFDETRITLIGYIFPVGRKNVKLQYNAGFVTAPYDLSQACLELAAQKFRRQQHIDQDSSGLGPEHVSFSRNDIPKEVQRVVNNYNNRFQIS